jgi:hypothetical protein
MPPLRADAPGSTRDIASSEALTACVEEFEWAESDFVSGKQRDENKPFVELKTALRVN